MVVAVGDGVTHVAVGDEVVALTPSFNGTSMLASYVTVPAGFVQRRPPTLSVEAAAAAPVAYLTAFYALCELAGLRAGESVLVHSATGGVGLAALAVSRMVGAEVIATAGSPEKRDHLRALGIEHVFDSRTTEFAEQIRQLTRTDAGVDVVLNSLVGDAIPAGLSVLAPRGRFLEIGKRDVYANSTPRPCAVQEQPGAARHRPGGSHRAGAGVRVRHAPRRGGHAGATVASRRCRPR